MKQTQMYSLCLIASLGFAAPVAAQQGMMDGRDGMMGGGMMSGMNSYAMRTFDANKDGTLTPEEMTAGMQAEIKTYDTDTNGALSLAEFEVLHAAHTRTMMVRAFQMHDEDGDGQVTEAEMATMAAMMEMMMKPAAGPQLWIYWTGGVGDCWIVMRGSAGTRCSWHSAKRFDDSRFLRSHSSIC